MPLKISLKIGGRVQITNREVLPVTLAIFDQAGQIAELVSYLAPLPRPLAEKFQQWQYYIGLQGNRRVAKNRGNLLSGVVNLSELASALKSELNKWLGEDGWIDDKGQSDPRVILLLEKLRTKITQDEEVQIIVQTEDRQLRGLPWQEWDVLTGYTRKGVEVAISATNFQRLTQKPTPQLRATARILVVFGDEQLDFREEEEFITNLKRYGGEPHILRQPTYQELEQKLKDPQGWHIFFFAGHSESDRNGRIGWIQINPSQGQEGIVEIGQLKDLLVGVINQKLQLAIFNSCDGLGLANQLTELSLPYCIVMREMVESSVARELLRHFLIAFVKDNSLFTAMNIARQQLQHKFEPGKSWLPVIVANPLAPELTWNHLFSERRLSWQWEAVLGIIAIAILICLPLSVFTEFPSWETFIFYTQLYPHLIVYPSLFLWISLFSSYKAHCMIRVKTRLFMTLTALTVLFTIGALFFELSGDRIMLLEFKTDAITTISAPQLPSLYNKWQTSASKIKSIPPEIFDASQAFDQEGNLTLKKTALESALERMHTIEDIRELQGLFRIATTYDIWKGNTQAFSISRWFYALTFVAIVGCGVQIFALVGIILFVPDAIFNKNKYLTYLVMCELGILLWIPFQGYSVEYIKSLLFSYEFRGVLAGLNILIYGLIALLFSTTVSSIYKSATKTYRPILLIFLLVSLLLTLLMGVFGFEQINRLFGMGSTDPLTPWFATTIFLIPLFFLLVHLIDLGINNE
ncbi:MAG: CHAT domain-containing protein [Calothrix sp. C42_A2020_038]|nr:CHAT domain-containing protein [Calothrix sp. C42_A2020_038]